MKRSYLLLWLTCLMLFLLSHLTISTLKAATLIIENGTNYLTGATGVLVNGSLYNVNFIDDSAVNLFDGCDDISDFIFQSDYEADMASQALLDQVLVGPYDDYPTGTIGIGYTYYGSIATPYGLSGDGNYVLVSYAFNASSSSIFVDGVWPGSREITDDLTGQNTYVYAVWENAVPIPGSAILFGSSFFSVIAIRRKLMK